VMRILDLSISGDFYRKGAKVSLRRLLTIRPALLDVPCTSAVE
jgi:hypothetical protein